MFVKVFNKLTSKKEEEKEEEIPEPTVPRGHAFLSVQLCSIFRRVLLF
jgi:hypothetical protein